MKKIFAKTIVAAGLVVLSASAAFAHSPLCSCFDNGDGTVMCEGGFSDGSSASGVRMFIRDESGSVVAKGKMDENSEYEFKKPAGAYTVTFDAGEGHSIEIDGSDIVE
ncbi:hypothetical protein [Maridesulfovibrio hydrothermalis]|uniref:Carboxypeptidase regulatory-like domain-containing protein n=1 Tax=Maridesulfovibrio hydrothermalis AM13 = DSM 14728 TaxID=1121451 RepID=L0R842_9BACT|nr:hypothetical protein [Maridesulfovibrio hydrothermalis]CCO22899.1 conserved exported protein of unknown function [Maridesulfovibrio hydrothermalis AM13 = DSM 14728]